MSGPYIVGLLYTTSFFILSLDIASLPVISYPVLAGCPLGCHQPRRGHPGSPEILRCGAQPRPTAQPRVCCEGAGPSLVHLSTAWVGSHDAHAGPGHQVRHDGRPLWRCLGVIGSGKVICTDLSAVGMPLSGRIGKSLFLIPRPDPHLLRSLHVLLTGDDESKEALRAMGAVESLVNLIRLGGFVAP